MTQSQAQNDRNQDFLKQNKEDLIKNVEEPLRELLSIRSLVQESIYESVNEALRKINEVPEDQRHWVSAMIAIEFAEAGKIDEALMIVSKAVKVVKEHPEEYWCSHALADIIKHLLLAINKLARDGRLYGALRLASEAVKIAKEIPDKASRYATLKLIALELSNLPIVFIDIPKVDLAEEDELEIFIESPVELENVLIEFEGVKARPIRLAGLRKKIIRLKLESEPGEKSLTVRVSYDYKKKRYSVEQTFEIEFKSTLRDLLSQLKSNYPKQDLDEPSQGI